MKTVIGALALLIAAPVAAHTAPQAGQQHQQHQQHGQNHQQGQHGQQDGKHAGCCKMVNGRMECQMMKGHAAHQGAKAQPQSHSVH